MTEIVILEDHFKDVRWKEMPGTGRIRVTCNPKTETIFDFPNSLSNRDIWEFNGERYALDGFELSHPPLRVTLDLHHVVGKNMESDAAHLEHCMRERSGNDN